MHHFVRLVSVVAALVFFSYTTLQTRADPLPERWQTKRIETVNLAERACTGNRPAMNEVKFRLESGDPVMMNSAGWLQHNCDNYKFLSQSEIIEYQRKSALAGYPIGLSNYGKRLIRGDLGIAKDRTLGLDMMEKAVEAGYGEAAYWLASSYIKGKYLPKNPKRAREYYDIAKSEGVASDKLAKLSSEIAIAQAVSSTGGVLGSKKQPVNQAEAAEQFAALAVSVGDGGYGFAHDYPDASFARSRALNECESRGGSDCDIKMVGRGKGCMSYHYAGGSATAHGWAIGATRSDAESRAAQECQKRNGNTACTRSAWVCNDRTTESLEVALNKPLPALQDGLDQCLISFELACDAFVPGKSRSTYIIGASGQKYALADCTNWRRKILWLDLRDNTFSSDEFTAEEKNRFKPALMAFKDKAISTYPACTRPYSVGINFHSMQSLYDLALEPDYWKKFMTYTLR